MENYAYTILDEVPSMPNEVLLSNIGGVLSLWLGITVMTLLEVTEALYFILAGLYEKRFHKKTEPVTAN
jgi:Amiloride-sensitive sodium channel